MSELEQTRGADGVPSSAKDSAPRESLGMPAAGDVAPSGERGPRRRPDGARGTLGVAYEALLGACGTGEGEGELGEGEELTLEASQGAAEGEEHQAPAGEHQAGTGEEAPPLANLDVEPYLVDLDVEEAITAAVKDRLNKAKGKNHDKTGRFLPGNTINNARLNRSALLWKNLTPVRTSLIKEVCTDLGIGSDATVTRRSVISGFVEVSILRRSMFARLVELEGAITGKGKVRALLSAYMAALDRELRLAQTLGLERKSKRVPSLVEALSEEEAAKAREEQEAQDEADSRDLNSDALDIDMIASILQ